MTNLGDLVQIGSYFLGSWVVGWAMGYGLYLFRRFSWSAT